MADETDHTDYSSETAHGLHVGDPVPLAALNEPMSPRERLRAFEDEKLGADCVRMNDAIEKGIGSMFQRLSEEDRAKHAALERLIVAHDKLDVAAAALGEAEMEAAHAEMAVENA